MNLMKNLILTFIFSLFFIIKSFATHNTGGFITCKNISGYNYKITVTTYTKENSQSDRPELVVYFGDGDSAVVPRINSGGIAIANGLKLNIYETTHTYAGIGIYNVHFEDPNRNSGIVNIPNSVNTPFFVYTELFVFDPVTDCISNSVDFADLPIYESYYGSLFETDLPMSFTDNDSITYEIVSARGAGGNVIPGYTYSGIQIDNLTGRLSWISPGTSMGQYSVVVQTKKWRHNVLVGTSTFDFMIIVNSGSTTNNSLVFSSNCSSDSNVVNNCFLVPGDTLNIDVVAGNNFVTVYSEFSETVNNSSPNIFTGDTLFTWVSNSLDERPYPNKITFRGADTTGIVDHTYLVYVGSNNTGCRIPPFLASKKIGQSNINVFPNPTNGIVNIRSSEIDLSKGIDIINILGQEINVPLIKVQGAIQLDLTRQAKGIYYVQFFVKEKFESKLIILEKSYVHS